MAMGSNTSYHYEEAPAAAVSRHSTSFCSGAVNSTWDMIPMGNQYGMSGSASMITPMSSNSAVLSDSGLSQPGTSSGSDGTLGLEHDTASYDTVKHFLQQNLDAFDQISANISTYKFQENIELFCHARNNITTVLNEMRQLPGLPRFPISINEDLMNCLLPDITSACIWSGQMTFI
uniref:Uncharacterized protein n=1 Tax=Kalanchoe fedtschenkoi TaxID=63787 RepID=A0A7N0ULC7_KALFE